MEQHRRFFAAAVEVCDAELTSVLDSLRVDFNKDRSVSAKEMQRWIMEKTEEHFQEATKENKNSFHAVDPDKDGERGDRSSEK